jgi:hypothetical protein
LPLRVPADLEEHLASGVDDTLEELRVMLGAELYPGTQRQDNDSNDDTEADSQQELQRLLAHLHDPVEPGSRFTTLQVSTQAQ